MIPQTLAVFIQNKLNRSRYAYLILSLSLITEGAPLKTQITLKTQTKRPYELTSLDMDPNVR